MVRRPELLLAPDCCDEVSCDETGLRPVLRRRQCRVWEGQTCLFHWQAGDPPPWYYFSYALEEGRNEGLLEGFLDWSEGVPDVRGDPMYKCLLLLE